MHGSDKELEKMANYFQTLKAAKEESLKKNPARKPNQAQLFLKVIVGGYLVYLAWQLYKGGALQTSGWEFAAMLGAIILFTVCGIWFAVISIKAILAKDYYDPNSPAPDADEETEAEDEEIK